MSSGLRTFTVVVAEDFIPVRERLVALLVEIPGVTVVGETAAVAETIAQTRALRPDVLMLDWSLHGGSGLDVLRQVSAERIQSHVIIVTNYAFPEYREKAIAAGAHAFFSKSGQIPDAIALIRRMASLVTKPARMPLAGDQS